MPLLDAFGRPLRPTGRVSSTDIIGVSGTPVFGGIPFTGERNSKLLGTRRYTTYSDMLANTAIIAAAVRFFLNLTGRAAPSFNPPDDKPEAKEYAERAEQMIVHDPVTPFRRIVRRSATFVFYGFSLQEWVMARTDEGMTFADISPRPQRTIERWAMEETGEVVGAWQTSPHTGREIFLPREKLVYLVDDSLNDSPEGLGLFRHIVDSAERLAKFQNLETMGYETSLAGIPVGRAPLTELDLEVKGGKLTSAQRDEQLNVLRGFLKNPVRTHDKAVILDSAVYSTEDEAGTPSQKYLWGIEPLEGEVNGQEAIFKAIERINREIARVFGAEQLLLGGDGAGSFALSEQKAVQMYLIVESTLDEIADAYSRELLDPIWAVNGFPDEMKPELGFETPTFHDIEQVAGVLRDLATAGSPVLPNDPVVREIYGKLGLPFEERQMEDDADAGLGGNEPEEEGGLPQRRPNGNGREARQ